MHYVFLSFSHTHTHTEQTRIPLSNSLPLFRAYVTWVTHQDSALHVSLSLFTLYNFSLVTLTAHLPSSPPPDYRVLFQILLSSLDKAPLRFPLDHQFSGEKSCKQRIRGKKLRGWVFCSLSVSVTSLSQQQYEQCILSPVLNCHS